jgi:hypothetical protein
MIVTGMCAQSNDWQALKDGARGALLRTARAGATITYAELLAAIGRPDGLDGLAGLLREISVEEDTAGRGLLTAVVVRSSGLPGSGFFELAAERGRDVSDRETCWRREHERVVVEARNTPFTE